jgi:RNA polymerase sigma-70 factor (ECF subfamily)
MGWRHDHGPIAHVPKMRMRAARPEPDVVDDLALSAALRAREPRAAIEVAHAYGPLVRRIVSRFLGPVGDPQDLCQEVFLRFFKRIDELRDPAALRGFLISIALGVGRNEARRARVRRWIGLTSSGDLPEVAGPITWDPEAREATAHLYVILERLSAEDRSLFTARFAEQLEVADVAAAHRMTLATVKRRLARLVKRLGAKMSRDPLLEPYVSLIANKKDPSG